MSADYYMHILDAPKSVLKVSDDGNDHDDSGNTMMMMFVCLLDY